MAADLAALRKITEHLAKERDFQPIRRDIIRVSSAGECGRKIGYKLLGFPVTEKLTVPELVTFEVGHAYHYMMQKWLCEMEWTTPELLEFPLADPTIRSRGSCDAITVRMNKAGDLDPRGTRRLIEIKSITNVTKERYGKSSEGAFDRLEKPREYHLDQANLYAHMWNRMVTEHYDDPFLMVDGRQVGSLDRVFDLVSHVTLVYIGKDTSENPIKVFTQTVSEKRIAKLKDKFLRIWSHVDNEELPDRDHDPFSGFPPCLWCPYQALCISDGVVELRSDGALFYLLVLR